MSLLFIYYVQNTILVHMIIIIIITMLHDYRMMIMNYGELTLYTATVTHIYYV